MGSARGAAPALPSLGSGSHQQNTGARHVEIFYPFHPLVGQKLWVRERRPGPPATYYAIAPNGEGLAVPVWMTDPAASEVRHEAFPQIQVRALLEIVELIRRKNELEPAGPRQEILPRDQAKEISREDQTTPTNEVDTGRAAPHTISATRSRGKEHRNCREDASRDRSTRTRVYDGGHR